MVVSIIGILTTILLPSLQKARDSAHTAVCLNNVKQVGVALINYSSEDEILPVSNRRWGDIMGSEAFLNTPSGTIQEQTVGNVLYCPTGLNDQISANSTNGGWNYINLEESRRPWESNGGKFVWYGNPGNSSNSIIGNWRFNTWNDTDAGTLMPKISLLVDSQSSIALHDGANYQNTSSGNGGRIAARHKGFKLTNTLFFDGHAKTILKNTLLSSRTNDGESDAEIIWRGSIAN